MKRKMLSALLCATLAASAMLTGCGNGGGSNTDAAPDNAQSKPQDTETASTEETDEEKQGDEDFSDITLVFAQDLGTDETANSVTNEILQAYQEKTGITIYSKTRS